MSEDTEAARTTRVDPDKCVWCKQPTSEDATPLGTGEAICESCLGDLREFKRTRYVDLLVSTGLESTTRTLLFEDWRGLRDRIVDLHDDDPGLKALPSRTSNADDYRIHGDSGESVPDR